MRPASEPSALSNTASSSAEDSATNSREPFGESASAPGLVPAPAERPVDQLATSVREARSITATRSSFATATYARLPRPSIVIPSGCVRWPSATSPIFTPPARSMNETVPAASFETRPVAPSGVIAAPYG
jgi:hypothetical protein